MSRRQRNFLIQALLFVLTLVTTTIAGAEWMWGSSFTMPFRPMGWEQFWSGLRFSLPFLGILTVHEFGHYFTAKVNRVKVTLPYYIPMWLGTMTSIGTLGAFIRIKSQIKTRQQYFDIGVAGPLAGFAVAVLVLWYGFTHLPPVEYIFKVHPEYQKFGLDYAQFVFRAKQPGSIAVGDNLLFWFFKNYIATDAHLIPHPLEMIHYPYLFAGYLALFFTALNLIPIGQLDGGHILYGLIGKRNHRIVSPLLFIAFMMYAGIGVFKIEDFAISDNMLFYEQIGWAIVYLYFLYLSFSRMTDNRLTVWTMALSIFLFQMGISYVYPTIEGYSGFLPFLFVLGRFLGIYHPEALYDEPLDWKRKAIGWLSLLVFALCFSPKPFIVH